MQLSLIFPKDSVYTSKSEMIQNERTIQTRQEVD